MPRPVVLLAQDGNDYWEKWVSYFSDVMLPDGYISEDDLSLFTICKSAEHAVRVIREFYSTYHSIRYVGKESVLRLEKELTDFQIDQLNEQFSDIVVSGKIRKVEPFDEEKRSRDQLKKQRIAFHFNKVNFGRLVEMIRCINDFSL